MQSYDPKDKENKKENEESLARTSIDEDEDKSDIHDSTTPLTTVKNKKRVHYPHINGERSALDTDNTDQFQNNYDKTTSGKEYTRLSLNWKQCFLSI